MPTHPPDDEEVRDFLAFAATEEGQRVLRPSLMKFLASVGIAPQVDATTGELVVDFPAVCAALGLDPAEEAERAGGHVRTVPADRLKPLQ